MKTIPQTRKDGSPLPKWLLDHLKELQDPNSEASKNAKKAYDMMNEEPEEE